MLFRGGGVLDNPLFLISERHTALMKRMPGSRFPRIDKILKPLQKERPLLPLSTGKATGADKKPDKMSVRH